MNNIFSTKTFIGTMVLTIIGSALWENIFKGFFNLVGRTLLTISTLGLEKYKNDIYINIARGFYEGVSIKTLSIGLGVLFGILLGVLFAGLLFKNREVNEYEKERTPKLIEWLKNHKRFFRFFLVVYTFFVISVSTLSLSKITYINKSIAYYEQLINIASPYLQQDQEKTLNSSFAQISNKEDYVKLINELSRIIKINRQRLPKQPGFIF